MRTAAKTKTTPLQARREQIAKDLEKLRIQEATKTEDSLRQKLAFLTSQAAS
jgi:hypothetical protein